MRCKKQCRTGQIAGLTPAAGRYPLQDLTVTDRIGLQGFGVGRGKVSGSNRIHLNVVGRPFVRERLGELRDAALGGGIAGTRMPPWKLSSEAILMIFPPALRESRSRSTSCES